MIRDQIQRLCERGQTQLSQSRYLEAEASLFAAEVMAWEIRDFDTIARLCLPLQESRRQRRQRCGEGAVCLDLVSNGPDDLLDPRHVIDSYPQGQLLVAGWGSIQPALAVRQLQRQIGLYVETFLAAAFPLTDGTRAVAIIPMAESVLPDLTPRSLGDLRLALPAHSLLFAEDELPHGSIASTAETHAIVMDLWQRLHTPFLAALDAMTEALKRVAACRRVIKVDYACELAHQELADAARTLSHSPIASGVVSEPVHIVGTPLN